MKSQPRAKLKGSRPTHACAEWYIICDVTFYFMLYCGVRTRINKKQRFLLYSCETKRSKEVLLCRALVRGPIATLEAFLVPEMQSGGKR